MILEPPHLLGMVGAFTEVIYEPGLTVAMRLSGDLQFADGQIFTLGLGDFHGKLTMYHNPPWNLCKGSTNPNSPKLISCRKSFSSSLDHPEHKSINKSQSPGQLSPLPRCSTSLRASHHFLQEAVSLLKGASPRIDFCLSPLGLL